MYQLNSLALTGVNEFLFGGSSNKCLTWNIWGRDLKGMAEWYPGSKWRGRRRTLYFDEGGRKKPEEVLQSATELSNGLNLQWCQVQRDETENSNTRLTAVRSRKPLGFSASYLWSALQWWMKPCELRTSKRTLIRLYMSLWKIVWFRYRNTRFIWITEYAWTDEYLTNEVRIG